MFLDATPSLELVLSVGWLVTLFQIQSLSLSLLVSHCLPLSSIVSHCPHCLPLSPKVSRWLFHTLSVSVNVSQHLSMSKRVASLRLGLVNLDGAWVTHFGGVVTKFLRKQSQQNRSIALVWILLEKNQSLALQFI